jgi:hypothetical protein
VIEERMEEAGTISRHLLQEKRVSLPNHFLRPTIRHSAGDQLAIPVQEPIETSVAVPKASLKLLDVPVRGVLLEQLQGRSQSLSLPNAGFHGLMHSGRPDKRILKKKHTSANGQTF